MESPILYLEEDRHRSGFPEMFPSSNELSVEIDCVGDDDSVMNQNAGEEVHGHMHLGPELPGPLLDDDCVVEISLLGCGSELSNQIVDDDDHASMSMTFQRIKKLNKTEDSPRDKMSVEEVLGTLQQNCPNLGTEKRGTNFLKGDVAQHLKDDQINEGLKLLQEKEAAGGYGAHICKEGEGKVHTAETKVKNKLMEIREPEKIQKSEIVDVGTDVTELLGEGRATITKVAIEGNLGVGHRMIADELRGFQQTHGSGDTKADEVNVTSKEKPAQRYEDDKTILKKGSRESQPHDDTDFGNLPGVESKERLTIEIEVGGNFSEDEIWDNLEEDRMMIRKELERFQQTDEFEYGEFEGIQLLTEEGGKRVILVEIQGENFLNDESWEEKEDKMIQEELKRLHGAIEEGSSDKADIRSDQSQKKGILKIEMEEDSAKDKIQKKHKENRGAIEKESDSSLQNAEIGKDIFNDTILLAKESEKRVISQVEMDGCTANNKIQKNLEENQKMIEKELKRSLQHSNAVGENFDGNPSAGELEERMILDKIEKDVSAIDKIWNNLEQARVMIENQLQRFQQNAAENEFDNVRTLPQEFVSRTTQKEMIQTQNNIPMTSKGAEQVKSSEALQSGKVTESNARTLFEEIEKGADEGGEISEQYKGHALGEGKVVRVDAVERGNFFENALAQMMLEERETNGSQEIPDNDFEDLLLLETEEMRDVEWEDHFENDHLRIRKRQRGRFKIKKKAKGQKKDGGQEKRQKGKPSETSLKKGPKRHKKTVSNKRNIQKESLADMLPKKTLKRRERKDQNGPEDNAACMPRKRPTKTQPRNGKENRPSYSSLKKRPKSQNEKSQSDERPSTSTERQSKSQNKKGEKRKDHRAGVLIKIQLKKKEKSTVKHEWSSRSVGRPLKSNKNYEDKIIAENLVEILQRNQERKGEEDPALTLLQGEQKSQEGKGDKESALTLVEREPKSKKLIWDKNGQKLDEKKLNLFRHRYLDIPMKKRPYKCKICRKKISGSGNFRKHLVIHTGARPFSCGICGKNFREVATVKVHMATHTTERPFKCTLCKNAYRRKFCLKQHMKVHEGEKPHACEHCGKRFIFKSDLTRHIRIHTGERPYKCKVCGKNYRQKTQLHEHMNLHNNVKPFSCDVCGKAFVYSGSLAVHLKRHAGDRRFKCGMPGCPRRFFQRANLELHMRYHTGEKPFKCDVCGRAFTEKDSLKRHNRVHTGERPYKCHLCEKAFKRPHHLNGHLTTHSKARPFTCNICQSTFKHPQHLKYHRQTHSLSKNFSCLQCGKRFNRKVYLDNHIKTHLWLKPHKCKFCGKRFPRQDYLYNHVRLHSGVKPFHCVLCDKAFAYNYRLRDHLRRMHKR